MKVRIETLALLHHIKIHHHDYASRGEVADSTGMHRISIYNTLCRYERAGLLDSTTREDRLPNRGSFKVQVWKLSTAGLKLLDDNRHRERNYRVLEPKKPPQPITTQ